MSLLKWTTKSISHLCKALQAQGHTVAETTVRRLLLAHEYTLQANRKAHEGANDPDRDAQFAHIQAACTRGEQAGQPIISVDCKKKELLGNFKNNGREWQPTGQSVTVNVDDFLRLAEGKAIPYGVYDLLHNTGFVNVGQDHDTAAFAVESIRRWWPQHGQHRYVGAQELLIVADGGGSNSARGRLWKRELQDLANETGLTVRVCAPAAGHEQVEQDRTQALLVHLHQLARPPTDQHGNGDRTHLAHHEHGTGLRSLPSSTPTPIPPRSVSRRRSSRPSISSAIPSTETGTMPSIPSK